MISLDEVLIIHEEAIRATGGSHGIRDMAALESAITSPFQNFFGQPMYPDFITAAARVAYQIIEDHCFIDGNKRTGYMVLTYLLMERNLELKATDEQEIDIILRVAAGNMTFEEFSSWIHDHVKSKIQSLDFEM